MKWLAVWWIAYFSFRFSRRANYYLQSRWKSVHMRTNRVRFVGSNCTQFSIMGQLRTHLRTHTFASKVSKRSKVRSLACMRTVQDRPSFFWIYWAHRTSKMCVCVLILHLHLVFHFRFRKLNFLRNGCHCLPSSFHLHFHYNSVQAQTQSSSIAHPVKR